MSNQTFRALAFAEMPALCSPKTHVAISSLVLRTINPMLQGRAGSYLWEKPAVGTYQEKAVSEGLSLLMLCTTVASSCIARFLQNGSPSKILRSLPVIMLGPKAATLDPKAFRLRFWNPFVSCGA